jgi:hypothetical protein
LLRDFLAQRRYDWYDDKIPDVLGLQTERFWIQVGVGVLFRLRVPPSVEADLAAYTTLVV